jgi:hypothetical protein
VKNSTDSANFKRLAKLDKEAGGAIELTVVTPADLPTLIEATIDGNATAGRLLEVVGRACQDIGTAPPDRPILCAGCNEPIGGSICAFVVASALRDNPEAGISVAVCASCATEPHDIERQSLRVFRKVWPGMRQLTLTGREGRA